ncbi:hypothetical protein [Candidatus Enterococcus mangumiae]|uniref:Uncharacterized protein n=1 Tax=Candidatus Enterococcus mangumiae TaxID=2230878 RepID=A0ABZ2SV41_9ENTE|nr:hypothetical protein [Enterococcus sp. DIV1094]MBO0489447.1 hypothetical protein [Enterococcus sp. DIV1094]
MNEKKMKQIIEAIDAMNTSDPAEAAEKLCNYLDGMYGLTARALRILMDKLVEEGFSEEQAFQLALVMSKS